MARNVLKRRKVRGRTCPACGRKELFTDEQWIWCGNVGGVHHVGCPFGAVRLVRLSAFVVDSNATSSGVSRPPLGVEA